MGIATKVTLDGSKNASVQITGSGSFDWVDAIRVDSLKNPTPRHLKLDAVYYAISEGTEIRLSWGTTQSPDPFLPLSGRGKLDFAEVGGCHDICGTQGDGIQISSNGGPDSIFTIILDLSKHIGERNG